MSLCYSKEKMLILLERVQFLKTVFEGGIPMEIVFYSYVFGTNAAWQEKYACI